MESIEASAAYPCSFPFPLLTCHGRVDGCQHRQAVQRACAAGQTAGNCVWVEQIQGGDATP